MYSVLLSVLLAVVVAYAIGRIMVALMELRRRHGLGQKISEIVRGKGSLFRLLYDVQDSQKHGGDVVASVLRAHDVKWIFTLCGGHISPILVGCEKIGIKVVDTRHEATAVFAADAVARLTGNIGVACVTAGPGLTNTVTAVKNAQMAESAVLLMGGATSALLKGRGSLQDIDQLALMKSICKRIFTVNRVQDLAPIVRNAIRIARSDVPGPVFVEVPLDVLHPFGVVEAEVKPKKLPANLKGHLTNLYLEFYICRLFSKAWKDANVTPLPIAYPKASESQVLKCHQLIQKSEKPVMLLGTQAVMHPDCIEDLVQAVQELGIPSYCNGMARGLLSEVSTLHVCHRRRDALRQADLIILAGSVCDFRLDYGRSLNPNAKIVCINRGKAQLRLNADAFWKPTLAVHGDPSDFIIRLSKKALRTPSRAEWLCQLKQMDKEREAEIEMMASTSAVGKSAVNSLAVLRKLESAIPRDAILVADGGDFVGSAAYTLRARSPLKWLDPGPFGTLGVGAGFALGAKLCRPHCPVWIIFGDGAFGYSLPEIDTFIRHNLPVGMVVGNDAGWGQILRTQVQLFNSGTGCVLAQTSYEKIAEGFGASGLLIDSKNIDKLPAKIDEATKHPKVFVINCLISRTSFRDGSISV